MRNFQIYIVLACLLAGSVIPDARAANRQVVAGAGPSTRVVQLFFERFSLQSFGEGYLFIVPDISIKHIGGIENSEKYVFGRTGRPLSAEEKAGGKAEIFLAKVPIAFVVSDDNPIESISVDQLQQIYERKIENWKEVGGVDRRIALFGREPTEAIYTQLKADYPFFRNVSFDLVMHRDHDVVRNMDSRFGEHAIAFGALPNFAGLNVLQITGGFESGVHVGLVYDLRNAGHPLVGKAKAFAASDAWRNAVAEVGLLPPDP